MPASLVRASSWRLLAGFLGAVAVGVLTSSPAPGLIRRTIAVDGNVADWGDILTDPENVVADSGSFSDPPDPDAPGTADRDLRGAAFTWDSTNLYVFFRRTLSGNSSFDFLAYIDLGHDGLLGSTDRILRLSYSGAAYQSGALNAYVPAAPGGDAVTGDGADEPGQLGPPTGGVPVGADSPDGIEFEASISWAALGVPAGTCLYIHPAIARGTNLPSQVEDNADFLDTQDVEILLERDRTGSAASPGSVDYAHRACNDGNCDDIADLTVRSQRNWRVEVWSDPNGDGNPSDGALRGVDDNGDGDYSDTGDSIAPGADANGNGVLDSGTLAAGACFTYVVRVAVPSGIATGTTDTERVRARSATRAAELHQNIDITTAGPVVMYEDEQRTGFPGDDVWTAHRACNNQGVTDTLNLSSASSLGWSTEVWSDPDGDGDPADGAPVTSTGPLAPGACFNVVARALVPSSETPGSVDTVTGMATSTTIPALTDAAVDTITVAQERFALTPNHARDAGPFNTLFLPHVVTNNQGADDSFALTVTGVPSGWTATLLSDANGNGEPDDSATIPDGGIVGPAQNNGGATRFLLRIDIPQGATLGTVANIVATARSQLDTTRTSTATDTITIRRILTYSDALFARPSATFFVSCAQVYVQAHGLESNRDYRFLWYDPALVLQRTSPTYQADARGRADDSFSLPCGVEPGQWRIDLQIRSGASWSNVDSANFTTFDPAVTSGDITLLETDQTTYNVDGDTLLVESELTNDTEADYVDTAVDYVVFRDANGDGVPTTGEDYMQPDGTRSTWDPGETTHETTGVTIYAGNVRQDFWGFANAQYGVEGTWCVHERWYSNCSSGSCSSVTIDTELRCFLVSCLPAPAVDSGADKQACTGSPVALSDSASDADTLSWSDGGAGGAFSPSGTVLHPTYSNPGTGTFTLTLTGTFSATGCGATDTVLVTIDPNPVVTAGADETTCASQAVALTDADGGIADTYSWSDGGAGGTFTPSATAENPAYANPTAGSYTLTFTATVTATSCSSSDTASVTVNADPVVTAGADEATCASEAVALTDADGGIADTYSWSDGGAGGTFAPSAAVQNPTYMNPAAGTYALTFTGTIGGTSCSSSDTVSVTVDANPAVSAGANESTCATQPVALSDANGGASTVYAWSDGGAGGTFTPSASVQNPSYANTTPGTYTLTFTGTVGATGCSSSDTLTVTVNAHPSVDAGAPKEGCQGAGIALSDATSDGATFSWSDGGAGGTFTPSAAVLQPTYTQGSGGSYTLTLTATSAAGCSSSDTVSVSVLLLPVASFTAPGGQLCEDTPVCFTNTSTNATSHLWNFGDPDGNTSTETSPCFAYSEPGTFTVTLTASNACGSNQTTRSVTIAPKPVADFSYSTQGNRFCRNKNVNFTDLSTNSPTSWQWDFDDGATSTAQNPTHAFLTDGIFIVSLIACNTCGCSAPVYEAVEIAATCNTNCEANSNQIECSGPPTTITGDTCTNHDNFNTTSYACAPGHDYSGENKSYDLNFLAGSNFVIRIVETTLEPNGYDLDIMISGQCNPPECVAWGDTEVAYDDRTTENDDFFLIVDGRDGSCGPFRLEVDCIDDTESAACSPPAFDGIVDAQDLDPCEISGILVTWDPAADWGTGTDGAPCSSGVYEIWRAPASDPTDERRVGSAAVGATSFTDLEAVPATEYVYKVHAINACCAEVVITTATAQASDEFNLFAVTADAGPDRTLTCTATSVTLLGSASGGSGGGFDFLWTPAAGLSDPTRPNPSATLAGIYTLTVTDRGSGCTDTDTVTVVGNDVPPVVSAGPDEDITCATPVVTLQGSATGGDPSAGRTYSWSPSGPLSDPASPTPQTSTPGTYTLTVTDAATGCSASDSVVVIDDDAPPTAGAGADMILDCDTLSVVLDGSASGGDGRSGYAYSWSPAAGLSDPSAQQPLASTTGTWTLTVTDVYTGCTGTDQVSVTQDVAAPVAGAGPDQQITCTVTTVTLDGSASGGNGSMGYAFAWSPAEQVSDATAEDPTTGIAGTYTLTVTDLANGCTSTDTAIVSLAPEVPIANAGPDKEITCAVTSVLLEGSASGGDDSAGYTYHWEPAGQVSDPDIAQPTTSTPGTYTLAVTTPSNGCTAQDTVVIADNDAPPAASAGPDGVLDCDTTSVVLQGSASGGDGSDGYSYSWSPAAGLSDPNVAQPSCTAPGTYTLTATDIHTSCVATDSVTVTQDVVVPVASAGPDATIDCDTPSVVLPGSASGGNGSLGYSFAWSPAAGLSDPNVAQPACTAGGTYVLTVTDLANGCADTDSVTVTQDVAVPVASAGPDATIDCSTPSAVLQGSASGGNGSLGYAYSWSPATGLSDPNVAQPACTAGGTYVLTVTDLANGCTDTDSVTVTPDVAVPLASAGTDETIDCDTPGVVLQGSASGGNGSLGYSYSWSPGAGLSDPNVAQPTCTLPGAYTLTVTDLANGCQDTDVAFVNDDRMPPAADAGPDGAIDCDTPSVVLQGSASGGNGSLGYSYSWSPPAGLSNPNVAQPTCTAGGTYTLTVTDLANACIATDTVTVTQGVATPVASAGPDKAIDCDTSSVVLEGSASGGDGSLGYSYAWTPPNGLSNPNVAQPSSTQARTYTLTVTDLANGCTATDTVTVLRDRANPVASAGPDRTLDCDTSSVVLQGSASGGNGSLGYAYSWTPGAGLSDPSAAQPTCTQAATYTLTVTDLANGCTGTDIVVVALDQRGPTASAGPDRAINCDTPSVTLDGSASGGNGSLGYSYSWAPATGLSDPNVQRPTCTAAGTYVVTVADLANGCTATDSVTVTADLRAPVANAGPDVVLDCSQPSVTLIGSASGGNGSAGYSYRWEPAGGVTDPTVAVTEAIAAGAYTLTVTDVANGCTDTDDVLVTSSSTPPVADAGADGRISCTAATASLSGSASGGDGSLGYTTLWSPSAGVADPNALVTTTTEPGTYTLLVTDNATGCRAVDSATIADDRIPPVADAGADLQQTCASPQVTLTGSASGGDGSMGYTFRWEPAADVADPNAASTTTTVAGTYTLIVTDTATGCIATDTVTLTLVAVPPFPEPSAGYPSPGTVPFRLGRTDPPTNDTVTFSWEDVGAFEYRIYAAPIAFSPPRGPGSYGHAAFLCGLTTPDASAPIMPGAVYFLVVATNCNGVESSYGRSTWNIERPDAATASGNACP